MLNFDVLEKGVRVMFFNDILWIIFWKKKFCYIYRPNFIVWLLLLIEILGKMCVVIIRFPLYGITNFEINLSFLIKLLFYMSKQGQD